jgi:hypothetical protein
VNAILSRSTYTAKQVLGTLAVFDDNNQKTFECKTLELPWKNNQVGQSCIPKGNYNVVRRDSEKFRRHFRIVELDGSEVTGRVGPILIHPGNFASDIRGCILIGREHQDINGDGNLDVTNSRDTLNALLAAAPNGFALRSDGIH